MTDRFSGTTVFIPCAPRRTMTAFVSKGINGVRTRIGQGMRLEKVNIEEQCEGMRYIFSQKNQVKARVGRGLTVIVDGKGRTFDLVGRARSLGYGRHDGRLGTRSAGRVSSCVLR